MFEVKDLGIIEKVRGAVQASTYDAIIAVGADSFQYLSGARIPYSCNYLDRPAVILWPREGDPWVVIDLCEAREARRLMFETSLLERSGVLVQDSKGYDQEGSTITSERGGCPYSG